MTVEPSGLLVAIAEELAERRAPSTSRPPKPQVPSSWIPPQTPDGQTPEGRGGSDGRRVGLPDLLPHRRVPVERTGRGIAEHLDEDAPHQVSHILF